MASSVTAKKTGCEPVRHQLHALSQCLIGMEEILRSIQAVVSRHKGLAEQWKLQTEPKTSLLLPVIQKGKTMQRTTSDSNMRCGTQTSVG